MILLKDPEDFHLKQILFPPEDMFRFLTTVLTLVAAVSAAVHDIDVGKGASLSFAPDTLTAAVGDT